MEGRSRLHKLWGDLYERRGLYPEAVEEYRAAQLIASQDAGASATPFERFSPPAVDDLEAWKELAASLKKIRMPTRRNFDLESRRLRWKLMIKA